jgi:hypothetical protein
MVESLQEMSTSLEECMEAGNDPTLTPVYVDIRIPDVAA